MRRASGDSSALPLEPSGDEVLERLRAVPLAPSVPKPLQVESEARSDRAFLVLGRETG